VPREWHIPSNIPLWDLLWNGVIAPGIERMAFGDSQQRKYAPFHNPMFFKGLTGILRAGGVEATARRQKG